MTIDINCDMGERTDVDEACDHAVDHVGERRLRRPCRRRGDDGAHDRAGPAASELRWGRTRAIPTARISGAKRWG